MNRVYKDLLQKVLLLCLHYRDMNFNLSHALQYTKEHWYDAYSSSSRKRDPKGKVRYAISFIENMRGYDSNALDELINDLTAIVGSNAEPSDRTLLDAIVDILGLPYAKHVLTGSIIKQLRTALMVPEEIADLRAMLGKELCCGRCGSVFASGEMTTFVDTGAGKEFYCVYCSTPSKMPCYNDRTKTVAIRDIKGLSPILSTHHTLSEAGHPPHSAEDLMAEILRMDTAQAEAISPAPSIPAPVFTTTEWVNASSAFSLDPDPSNWAHSISLMGDPPRIMTSRLRSHQ
jgi:hypothetical protein